MDLITVVNCVFQLDKFRAPLRRKNKACTKIQTNLSTATNKLTYLYGDNEPIFNR